MIRYGMKKRVIFHAAAAVATVLLLLLPLAHDFLTPADSFTHANFLLVGHLQFLLAAFVFYGFSLVLVRLVPLSTPWSLAYTALSWLFFLWAFYPTQNPSGMMRRVAGTMEDYLAAERHREQLHLVVMLVFALIQTAYLSFAMRFVANAGAEKQTLGPANLR